ncbi:60S ribosomal protein L18-3 [Acorus calamus]|uniref:60S ribosomal protein L18-3 n=1 Tax=Acorus calamus TaxID=4465 RepID=A0AAV9DTI8_ACOCL|nr:60S ribosomal protein L18-3 [Acorus calamus]
MTMTRTILLLTILTTITDRTVSDPQTNLLTIGCSQYNASNPADFISKLNQTFSDLRSQINNASTRFATAQQPQRVQLSNSPFETIRGPPTPMSLRTQASNCSSQPVALNSDDIYLKLFVKVPREEDREQFNAVILKRLFMSKTNNGRNSEFGPKRSPNQEETMLVLPWLEPLLSLTFFTICRVHGDSMRSECNMEFSSDIGSMFGNMNNSPGMSSADPFVRRALNKWFNGGGALDTRGLDFKEMDSSGVWEPTTLLLNLDGYLVKNNHKPGAQDEVG